MALREKWNKYAGYLLIFILGISVLGAVWTTMINNADVRKELVLEDANGVSFTAPFDEITSFGVSADNWQQTDYLYPTKINLTITILDSEQRQVFSKTYNNIQVANYNIIQNSQIKEQIKLNSGEKYTFHYKASDTVLNHMTIALYGQNASLKSWYMIVSLLILAVLECVTYVVKNADQINTYRKFAASFFIVFMLTGVIYSIVMIPFSVQDEPSHFATAYLVSNEIMGKQKYITGEEVAISQSAIHRMNWGGSAQEQYQFWCDSSYTGHSDDNMSSARLYSVDPNIPRYVYWIPGFGITIFRLFHAPYQLIVLSGRWMNLLMCAILLLVAIRLNWGMRRSIIAISFLPVSSWLFASYSYDAWNLSWMILMFSFCMYCMRKNGTIGWKEILSFSCIAAITIPVKMIYIFMLFMVFLIPVQKWRNHWKTWISFIAGTLLVFMSLWYTRMHSAIAYATTDRVDNRSITEGTAQLQSFTVSWLITHPMDTIKMYMYALYNHSEHYIYTSICGGWDGEAIYYYIAYAILFLMLVVFATDLSGEHIGIKKRIISLGICIVQFFVILTTFILVYTHIPNDGSVADIQGVQGRYFLPILLFLPLIIKNKVIQVEEKNKKYVLAALVVLNLLCIVLKTIGVANNHGLLEQVIY